MWNSVRCPQKEQIYWAKLIIPGHKGMFFLLIMLRGNAHNEYGKVLSDVEGAARPSDDQARIDSASN